MFRRPAFTLVELLVVIGVISVTVALVLPAIQQTREAARRVACANHLRQIGLALHSHHTALGAYPVGCLEWRGNNPDNRQLAWSAFLLPFLEQQPLFDSVDFSSGFDSAINQLPSATQLTVYRCPSSTRRRQSNLDRALTDYGGMFGERINSPNNPPKGVMLIDRPTSDREIIDGLSNTVIVAEDAFSSDGEWINGLNIFDQAFPINGGPSFENDIRSQHPGGANLCFCDGSVRFFSNSTQLCVLASVCTRDQGELCD